MAKKVIQQPGEPVMVTLDVPDNSQVQMTRDPGQYPVEKYGPSTASVHIDEVENWAKGGWVLAKDGMTVGEAGAD